MATSYDAFISYSHAADGKLAPALQDALQRFAKPWYRLRALHLFRDQTSLSATPGLWPAIEAALTNSRYFLLLASPEAADSRWVQQEVRWWLEHQSPQTMLIGLTDGKIAREEGAKDFDWEQTDALPPSLKGMFTENPLWVDFRWAKGQEHLSPKNPEFQNALAALAAPLRGVPKEDLIGVDVRQHRRALFLARGAAVVLVLLLAASLAAALFAAKNQYDAEQQAQIATARAVAAQSGVEGGARRDERAALLARQAYLISTGTDDSALGQLRTKLFGKRGGEPALAQVDPTLRQALGASHFRRNLNGHRASVKSILFPPDGQTLITGSADESIRLWNLRDRSIEPDVMDGGDRWVADVALADDGHHLAAGDGAGNVRWWPTPWQTTTPVVLPGTLNQTSAIAVSPDGRTIVAGELTYASGVATSMVEAWTEANPGSRRVILGEQAGFVAALAFRPDGTLLIIIREEGGMRLWMASDERATAATRFLSGSGLLTTVAFNADRTMLAAGSRDGTILWWRDFADPSSSPVELPGGDEWVNAIAFSPDSRMLGAGSQDGTVRWWRALGDAPPPPVVLPGDAGPISSLTFSPDGRALVAGDGDGVVHWWELRELGAALSTLAGGTPVATEMAFSPNGTHLAVAGHDGSMRVWDLADPGTEPITLAGGEGRVTALEFAADGNALTAHYYSDDVLTWNLDDPSLQPASVGNQQIALPDDITVVNDLTTRLDGTLAAVGGLDGRVHVWDPTDLAGTLVILPGDGSEVSSIAFSEDAGMLAVGSRDAMVHLWREPRDPASTPESLSAGVGWVNSVAFSPDGQWLAVGSRDGTVRIWNLRDTALPPRVAPGDGAEIEALAFGPDGQVLAVQSGDTVQLWTVPTSVLAERVCAQVWRNLSVDEWVQFVGQDVPYQATCPGLRVPLSDNELDATPYVPLGP